MNKLKILTALLFICIFCSCASTEDISAPIVDAKFTYFTDNMTATFINGTEIIGCLPESYKWDFGDDNITGSYNATHVYGAPNVYIVKLTVVDCIKRKHFAVKTIPVGVPIPMVLPSFVYTNDNLTVRFTNNTTITNGTIKQLLWTFGDGGISNTATVVHKYPVFGTYTVRLVVIDNLGSESFIEQSILVSPTLPPEPTPPTPTE